MGKRESVVVGGAILLHVVAAEVRAADLPDLSFNGFGTAGVVHSSEEDADFVSNGFAPEGVGNTSSWSVEVDSRLGLQLRADLTPRVSSVAQIIIEQRHDDTYTPTVEWANIKFDVTPDLSVRAGRTVLPIFMVSEFRKVGYANPWVRPPPEVYQLVPITRFDGFDVSYRSRFGRITNTLRGAYGRTDSTSAEIGEIDVRDGFLLRNILEHGPASFFATYTNSRVTLEDIDPLFDGFRQFGPAGQAIADQLESDGKRFETLGVGARYDAGDWFLMGEWARTYSRTFIRDSEAWYVTGGYRFDSLTPYITLAGAQVEDRTSHPGLSTMGPPAPVANTARGLNARLNQLLGTAAEQQSVAVGIRWDLARNISLKLQYDYIDIASGSRGVLINEQPGFQRGGTVSLFSILFDFVF